MVKFHTSTGEFLGTFTSRGHLSLTSGMSLRPTGNSFVNDLNLGHILRYNVNWGLLMGVFGDIALHIVKDPLGKRIKHPGSGSRGNLSIVT